MKLSVLTLTIAGRTISSTELEASDLGESDPGFRRFDRLIVGKISKGVLQSVVLPHCNSDLLNTLNTLYSNGQTILHGYQLKNKEYVFNKVFNVFINLDPSKNTTFLWSDGFIRTGNCSMGDMRDKYIGNGNTSYIRTCVCPVKQKTVSNYGMGNTQPGDYSSSYFNFR